MFAKLNHLAITSDHYTLLGMFYRAAFGLKASGDTAREIGAISVGDGYLGMTLIPRRGGRKAGLDHFGIEVADLDKVRAKVAKKYPDVEIVKRPGNRPFASYSAHDPAGNYFDLSQPGHENRAEVYAKGEWKQDTTFSHFALRAREAQRVADFYVDVFELEARNLPTEEGGYHLTDGRVTMAILPWKFPPSTAQASSSRAWIISAFACPRSMPSRPTSTSSPRPTSALRRSRSISIRKARRGSLC
jgi:predicted enzyme related to lactoylglutathione lyase